MKHRRSSDSYLLRLDKGEQLIAALTGFCAEQNITSGFFTGLGGVMTAELGYYLLDERRYEFKTLDNVLEIASLHGNVALKDGAPFLHAHAVLGDAELNSYAGHVKELTVGGTCEIWLRMFDEPLERTPGDTVDLATLDL